MTSGFIKQIGLIQYEALEAVRSSHLKHMAASPLHYLHATRSDKDPEKKPSPSLILGDATHAAVFEPERFVSEYAAYPGRRAGKAYEDWKDRYRDWKQISEKQHATASIIAEAVHRNTVAMGYLKTGSPEVAMSWVDPATGMAIKARVDWLDETTEQPVIFGLKTTRDASVRAFSSQAANLFYHLQWAMYHDGYMAIRGKKPLMIEAVVDNKAPHDVVVYEIQDDTITGGRYWFNHLMAKVVDCTKTNLWPGRFQTLQTLKLPEWAFSLESAPPLIFDDEEGEDA